MTAGQPQRSIIVVHPDFDRTWPWAADHFRVLWEAQGQTEFFRLAPDDRRAVCEIVADPAGVTRLVALNVPVTVECAARMQALREAVFSPGPSAAVGATLAAAGVRIYVQSSEGFWGQSVAEFALALTLCGLRRIPQLHRAIVTDPQPWDYTPPGGVGHARRTSPGPRTWPLSSTLGARDPQPDRSVAVEHAEILLHWIPLPAFAGTGPAGMTVMLGAMG
jgi:hypothetical protein